MMQIVCFLCVLSVILEFYFVSSFKLFRRDFGESRNSWKLSSVKDELTTVQVGLDTNTKTESRSYPIYIDNDLIQSSAIFEPHLRNHKKVLIVSNEKVGPLYIPSLRKTLQSLGKEVHSIELPDGEEYKDMVYCMKILDKSLEIPLDRKSIMIALGGGVIGDMCGFAASIYQRGVAFVQVPTSLMAMVDSSVGGKTAVNHPLGKNMIGSFYQPKAVVIDIQSLHTLPEREYRSGIAEVLKYGLINDFPFFEWIERNADKLLKRESSAVKYMIQRSCENKAAIVSADEKEEIGIRALLNLGHTFGHAIETGFGYGVWLHGEAIAAGMMMAADLSHRQQWIDASLVERIRTLLLKFQLPVDLHNEEAVQDLGEKAFEGLRQKLSKEYFYQMMTLDKKVSNGKLHLILLKPSKDTSIVESVLTEEYSLDLLHQTIAKYCQK